MPRLAVRRLAVLCVTAVTLLLAACTGSTAADGGFVSGDGTITRVPLDKRTAAPVIEGTTLDDKPWSSSSASGRVLVYNVWGSWCPPCVKEAPALVRAAQRTEKIAQFVGLNTRDLNTAQPRAFIREFKVPYPNLFDPDGALVLKFAGKLPLNAIPSTVIVAADGRIAARVLGEATEATLVGLIEDVAAGR
ncbi:MAG: TlpA disulfide reductase family protein [Micropruina sp.]|uniref:TlpA family protein disulfide reductase n=1 Tax=Micropruina sp. TaxID=2737536 RepID=UPI0039E22FC7